MTNLPITLLTTSVLLLIFLVLSARVIGGRVATNISLGTGTQNTIMQKEAMDGGSLFVRARTHANFAEYVPISLIGLGMLELHKAPHGLLVGIAVALVIARVGHAFGMTQAAPNPWRFGGTLIQLVILGVLGGYGVLLAF